MTQQYTAPRVRSISDRMLRELSRERRRRASYVAPPRDGLRAGALALIAVLSALLVSAAAFAITLIATA